MSLEQEQQIVFGPFQLDPRTGQLQRGEQAVVLEPTPLAVLRYLAARPGQLVPKHELLKAIWVEIVTKAVLKTCVHAIRKALGDDVTTPQYIETVRREGYRFVGDGRDHGNERTESQSAGPASLIVGREPAVEQLQHWVERALRGERQLVFVSGEPGIGKTALVDLLQEQFQKQGQVWVGRGQCVEQYGEGEAYLPILEALTDLAQGPGSMRLTENLRRYAPTWLVQLPALVSEAERHALQATVHGATRERRLREIVEALEAVSHAHPVVIVLEDLHWSDPSTVELLSFLAQRRQLARLCLLGTYRPVELVMGKHPLKGIKQELQAHGQCQDVRVELLSAPEVREYLARRFPQHSFPSELATTIHRRTEGNALFMVNVVEELVSQGIVVQDDGHWRLKADLSTLAIPSTVRQLIDRQVERLSEEEQQVLEVASVAGTDFSVAAAAAALKQEIDTIEDVCEGIAWQGHFLEERGIAEWADGTVSGRYEFRHALYQNVLYERIAEARRIRLHRQIGERIEIGYGEQAREVAAELAMHFERGRDYQRAVQYLRHAAGNAIKRSANIEVITHLTAEQALLPKLPDTSERFQREIEMLTALGAALMAVKGFASLEVEQVQTRLRQLCQQVQGSPPLFRVLPLLRGFYLVLGELQTARELAEQYLALALAQRTQSPALLVWAYYSLGETLLWSGEMRAARDALERSIAFYDPQQLRAYFSTAVQDPGVASLTCTAAALWIMGYPDQGRKRIHEAIALAQELSHPFTMAWALRHAALHHQFRREMQLTREKAEAGMTLSVEHGFPFWFAIAEIDRGWAFVEQGQRKEGIAQMQQGLTTYRGTGAELSQPYFLGLLAGAHRTVEQSQEGLSLIAEGLQRLDKTGERFWEAELHRLEGELTLQQFKVQGSKFQVQTSPKSKVQSRRSKKNQPSSPNTQPPSRRRSVFPQGQRDCSPAASEVVGTAGRDESRAALATTRQESRSPADAGRDLRLVHRRVRHEGFARGEGTVGRA